KERGLSFELVDRAVDVWFPFPNTHVAGKVTRGQIVGTIDYDVVIADQLDSVAGGQSCRVGLDDDRWVDGKQTCARRIGFLAANVVRSMQELPVKIAKINRVLIPDSESADAGGGEIKRCWRTQPAGADAQYPRFLQSALTLFADLRKIDLARVTLEFSGTKVHFQSVFDRVLRHLIHILARFSISVAARVSRGEALPRQGLRRESSYRVTRSQLIPTTRRFSNRFSDFGKTRYRASLACINPTIPNSVPLSVRWIVMMRLFLIADCRCRSADGFCQSV